MDKQQLLKLLMFLSAVESWSFSVKESFPDSLQERLDELIDKFSKELLRGV